MLDALNNVATEHHFVRNGLIIVGSAFAIVLIFKSAAGKWWWRHEKKHKEISRVLKGSDPIGVKLRNVDFVKNWLKSSFFLCI